jgi:hypothetical protein
VLEPSIPVAGFACTPHSVLAPISYRNPAQKPVLLHALCANCINSREPNGTALSPPFGAALLALAALWLVDPTWLPLPG